MTILTGVGPRNPTTSEGKNTVLPFFRRGHSVTGTVTRKTTTSAGRNNQIVSAIYTVPVLV